MSCLENTNAYDGGLPFVIGSPVSLPNCLTVMAHGARLQLSVRQRRIFLETIRKVPVVSLSRFYEYGMMLHYCITEEKICIDEIIHIDADVRGEIPEMELADRHGNYLAEQELLNLVKEGNLLQFSAQGPLQNSKNAVLMFVALVSRAAIRGGLMPEIAYTLGDIYAREVDQAKNIATLTELNHRMLSDFIRRVHRIEDREQEVSPQIRQSCEYIQLHLQESVELSRLAKIFGYSDYYFSLKFKKEMGMTVKSYITTKKMDRAREALLGTNDSVEKIAFSLGFHSSSYFYTVFKKHVGMTPQEYREKYSGSDVLPAAACAAAQRDICADDGKSAGERI